MKCPNCGANCDDTTKFCPICGNPFPEAVNLNKETSSFSQQSGYQQNSYQQNGYQQNGYQQNGYQQNSYQQNAYQNGYVPYQGVNPGEIREENLPENLRPLSPWAYFGYMLLFSLVPCAGLIIAIVFAVSNGPSDNVNRRNFARGYLIVFAVSFILSFLFVMMFGATIANLYSYYL